MTAREKERYGVIRRLIQGEIVASEASKQLHVGVRQVQRIKKEVKKDGVGGVIHGNRGQPSNRRLNKRVHDRTVALIKKHYADFGPTLASEKLLERHDMAVSISCVRHVMIGAGLWKPKSRKASSEYRSWRPRKEQEGEMEQFDGSYHKWFEDRAPECCLLASIDDATGKILYAKFDQNESVRSVFTFWDRYIHEHGKPISIYLDKYSTYKINHPSAVDNSELMTQFQRAMQELDIRVISAHSPQAKGRIERVFDTLQDRLVKELRLRNISTIEKASVFLKEEFIPWFNNKFSVVPEKPGNLHRPLSPAALTRLPAIFAVHSQRKVNNDFTIRFQNQWIQLSETQSTTVYKKDTVLIEQRLDQTMHIRLNQTYLNYTILPQRPKKLHTVKNIPLPALTNQPPQWKPSANHPWRKRFHADIKERIAVAKN